MLLPEMLSTCYCPRSYWGVDVPYTGDPDTPAVDPLGCQKCADGDAHLVGPGTFPGTDNKVSPAVACTACSEGTYVFADTAKNGHYAFPTCVVAGPLTLPPSEGPKSDKTKDAKTKTKDGKAGKKEGKTDKRSLRVGAGEMETGVDGEMMM